MSKGLRHLIERFPEHEAALETLSGSSANFDTLCAEYGEMANRLNRLTKGGEPGREADELRRRRAAIEDELLAMMQQNARV
jgi:uncharacterized protein YdcH (DUF465 family)